MSHDQDSWGAWQRHVLAELKRLSKSAEEIERDIGLIQKEIALLKLKSGLWGTISAIVSVIALKVFGDYF